MQPSELFAVAKPNVPRIAFCAAADLRFLRLSDRLLDIATDEFLAAQDQMLLSGRKTALEKIVLFLLQLSKREQRRGAGPKLLDLQMTRGDITYCLGLTIENLSCTLSGLKSDALIG